MKSGRLRMRNYIAPLLLASVLLFLSLQHLTIALSVSKKAATQELHTCTACVNEQKVWCGIQSKCVETAEECNHQLNITWFFKHDVPTQRRVEAVPSSCQNGVMTTIQQCIGADIYVQAKLTRENPSETWNMIYPFSQQPMIHLEVVNNSQTLIDGYGKPWEDIFVIGAYFVATEPFDDSEIPRFFSYNYHVNRGLPAAFQPENSRILFQDLNINAKPGYYSLGYSLMVPIKQYDENMTEVGVQYMCSLFPSSKKVYQNAVYYSLYKGPHIFLGVPLLVLSLTLISITFICCGDRFQPTPSSSFGGAGSDNALYGGRRHFMKRLVGSRKMIDTIKDLLVSLVVVPDSAIVKHCGTDAYFFLWFQRQLIVYCTICGAITMAVLLPIYFMSTDIDIYQDFASTTVASLHLRQNPLAFVQLAITIGFPLVGCIFLWRVRRLARSVIKPNANFASLFSAMISGLSPDVKNKNELKAYFAERYGRDSVADVNIIYELNKLKRLVEKKEEATKNLAYYEKQYEKSRKRPTIQNGCCGSRDAIGHYRFELEKCDKKIAKAQKAAQVQGTGYAFVTFTSIKKTQEVLRKNSRFCCGVELPSWLCFLNPFENYLIKPAPEPEDIIYENLGYSCFSKFIRGIISNLIVNSTLVMLYSITIMISVYQYFKSQNTSVIYDWASAAGATFVLTTIVDLLPELVSVTNELIKPVVEFTTHFEKHYTRLEFRKSVMRKTAFYMCVNTLVFPNLFVYWKGVINIFLYAQEPFNNYTLFFNHVGVGMLFLLVVLCTIAKGLELGGLFLGMMIDYIKTKRLKRPVYDYESSYGFKIAILMLALIFGSTVPFVFPFVIFFYVFTYYLDKYLIMYVFERTKDSDGRILNHVADTTSYYLSTFPIYIFVMLPSLLLLWKTWLVFIPAWCTLAIILVLLKRYAKRHEDDRIILSTDQPEEDEHEHSESEEHIADLEDPAASPEPSNSSPEPSSASGRPGSVSFSDAPLIKQQSALARIHSGLFGKEKVLDLNELDSMGLNSQELARRYTHPCYHLLFQKEQQ